MTCDDAAPRRIVSQTPRKGGHLLQPSWSNPDGFLPRIRQVAPHVRGKTLLDIGCTSALGRPDWIHAGLAQAAGSIVGIDIDEQAVRAACNLGYDVRLADAESLDIHQTFEVIHAGELIEHLDNPSSFLAACRRHLAPGGRLILTTPNPFAISNFVYRLGGTPRVNGDHTCWYCEDTLRQLLDRNGFEVVESAYLVHETPGRSRKLVSALLRGALPDRLAWNTLLAVAQLNKPPTRLDPR